VVTSRQKLSLQQSLLMSQTTGLHCTWTKPVPLSLQLQQVSSSAATIGVHQLVCK
jgi:hypothetical protein